MLPIHCPILVGNWINGQCICNQFSAGSSGSQVREQTIVTVSVPCVGGGDVE